MAGVSESATTTAVRRRYGVPDGVALRADPREVLACLPGYEIAVRGVAAHPDSLPPSTRRGRRPLRSLGTALGEVLVREARKGGLLRGVRGRWFLGQAWRPLAEFVLHRRLTALEVPVSDAVGCVILRRPYSWRGFLLLLDVAESQDLEAWLWEKRSNGDSGHDVLREVGRAIRQLHDAGVRHADLHPKNLLLTKDGRVLILDLDRARSFDAPLVEADRVANLARLARSITKHRLRGLRFGAKDALRFLEGYAGSREAGRQWWPRIERRLRRGLVPRMLWWRLIGETRPRDMTDAPTSQPPPGSFVEGRA
jgi:3-deoxy-D-manno-octulosonic acid kinase